MKYPKSLTKEIVKDDFYSCGRCNITSLTKDRMCPCPRGSCEAKIVGEITKTIITEFKSKQK